MFLISPLCLRVLRSHSPTSPSTKARMRCHNDHSLQKAKAMMTNPTLVNDHYIQLHLFAKHVSSHSLSRSINTYILCMQMRFTCNNKHLIAGDLLLMVYMWLCDAVIVQTMVCTDGEGNRYKRIMHASVSHLSLSPISLSSLSRPSPDSLSTLSNLSQVSPRSLSSRCSINAFTFIALRYQNGMRDVGMRGESDRCK